MQKNNNFPLIVKTGNDIVYIPRIKNTINKFGLKLLNRILIKDEITYCINDNIINTNAVAKRFSAKEALVKAIGIGFGEIATFKDMGVVHDKNNKPFLKLSSRIINYIYDTLNLDNFSIDLSLSDDRDYALATVVIIGISKLTPYR